MTNEKMLEMVYIVASKLSASDQELMHEYNKIVSKGIMSESFVDGCLTSTLPAALGEMIRVLKIDIAKQEEKKSGKNKQASVIKSVIKNSIKTKPTQTDKWGVSYVDEANRQYVVDGFRAFIFNEKCDSVPISDEKLFKSEVINLCKKVMPTEWKEELEIPDRNALATYIKAEKAKRSKRDKSPIVYNFGKNLPMVNAEYLLDMLDGIQDGTLYNTGMYSVIYIKGLNGEAVLAPMEKSATQINAERTKM